MIHPTAIIHPGTQIGVDVEIGPYAVIGFPGEARLPSWQRPGGRVRIGDRAVIHEYGHVQSGIHGTTVIGDDLLLMAGGHIAHDCQLGNQVTVSAGATLAGHVNLDDLTTVGINAAIHQYAHVRMGSLIGAQSFFKGETGEWEIWAGVPARLLGGNTVGYERHTEGFSHHVGTRFPPGGIPKLA